MAGLSIHQSGNDLVVSIARSLPVAMRGAAVLAVLTAPPRQAHDPKILLAYRRWCRGLLYLAEQEVQGWEDQPQHIAPADLAWQLPDAERKLRQMLRDIERRLGAAYAARRFLQAAESAAIGGSGKRRTRLSIEAEIIRTNLAEDELRRRLATLKVEPLPSLPADPDNFETRALRPSLPVLHLAYAYSELREHIQRELAGRPLEVRQQHGLILPGADDSYIYEGALGNLVTSGAFQESLLDRAERLEVLLPFMPKLRPMRVVRVRLEEGEALSRPAIHFVPISIERPAEPGDGLTVRLPAEPSPEQAAITLLATLACPPRSAADRRWSECVAAFSRVLWHHRMEATPEEADRLQPAIPAHLTMPLPRARKLVERSLVEVLQRLRAAQALSPAFRVLAGGGRLVPEQGGWRWSLAGEIRRVLAEEAKRTCGLARRPGRSSPSARPTRNPGPAARNFEARVIGPARSVLHLAVALAFTLRRMAGEQGINTTPEGVAAESGTGTRVRLDWPGLVDRHPDCADVAVGLAKDLEEVVLRLPAGGPNRGSLVRLRVEGR
jgi:hypothetical protein